MPKISVVMPVYNSEKHLNRTIKSVMNQSYADFELIAVNDGSTDDSLNILNDFASQDSRIVVVNKKNTGVSDSRNTGIRLAKGEYLTFLDSDDLYFNHAFEDLLSGICDVDLVYAGYQDFYLDSVGEPIYAKKEIKFDLSYLEKNENLLRVFDLVMGGLFNQPWNKIYKTEIIKNNTLLFDISIDIGEDFLFNLDYCQCIQKAKIIPQVVYAYNKSECNLTKKYRHNRFEIHKKLALRYAEVLEKNELNPSGAYAFLIKSLFGCVVDLQIMPIEKDEIKQNLITMVQDETIQKIANSNIKFDLLLYRYLKRLLKRKSYNHILTLSKIYGKIKYR